MSSEKDRSAELDGLLNALCEERLSEPERQRLNQLLREGEEARWRYLSEVHLHAALLHLSGLPTVRIQQEEKRSARPAIVLDVLGDVFRAGGEFLSRSFVLTLFLAIGLPLIVLTLLIVDVARQPVAKAPVPVAVAEVTDSLGCVLAESGADLPAGTRLFPGQGLQLKEGLAELTFADGAKAVLQGPATFRIDGSRGGRLDEGSLSATVPPPARGFTIETPYAKVVDFGTEFGVLVAADGRAEAHVFLGEVEVAAGAGAIEAPSVTKRLRAGEAVEVRAGGAGKAPELVAMAAEAGRFVRRLPEKLPDNLPKPTIIFAHRGANDPAAEGWRIRGSDVKGIGKAGLEVGPIDEDGVSAWSFRTREDNQVVYYSIEKAQGLTPDLIAEAEQKGWVLRARVWMSEKNQIPPDKWKGLAHFGYREGEGRVWTLRPTVDRDGNQALLIRERSSLGVDAVVPIPGSRNRYVDYEMRYHPATRDAEVFVNGRRVATVFSNPRPAESGSTTQLRFGGWRPAIDARFALVEWGILRDAPTPTVPNITHTHGEKDTKTSGTEKR